MRADRGDGSLITRLRSPLVVLPFLIFWSTLDRAFAPPLVTVIAAEFGVALSVAGLAITAHALSYAVLQLMWGPLSTRIGRIRVLTISTAIAAVANLVSAVAPDAVSFVVARAVSGGAFAATFAAVLTYYGDTLPLARRPAAMSNLAIATSLALAFGTLGAAAVAQWASWRLVFGVFAVVTALLVPAIIGLPDARGDADERILGQVVRLGRNRWALLIFALTAAEGALLIGVFNLLPVALQITGETVFVSGLTTAAYGVAVVVTSQVLKRVVSRIRPWAMMVVGGASAATAFIILVIAVTPLTVLAAAAAMGVAWAFGHTTLQTWVTDAASDARAMGMTFFSISLMLGGAAGAALATLAVEQGALGPLYAGSVLVAAAFGVAAALGRARYRVRDR